MFVRTYQTALGASAIGSGNADKALGAGASGSTVGVTGTAAAGVEVAEGFAAGPEGPDLSAIDISIPKVAGERGARGFGLDAPVYDGRVVFAPGAALTAPRSLLAVLALAAAGGGGAEATDSNGISNFAPQWGQMPRFPAKNDFTFNLWPLGQRNRIPIFHPFGTDNQADSAASNNHRARAP